jgi:Tfp pilus assembly protein PilF
LQESATKLPEYGEIQYHLGMTQFKLGNTEAAKAALGKALTQGSSPTWAEEARKALAQLR